MYNKKLYLPPYSPLKGNQKDSCKILYILTICAGVSVQCYNYHRCLMPVTPKVVKNLRCNQRRYRYRTSTI